MSTMSLTPIYDSVVADFQRELAEHPPVVVDLREGALTTVGPKPKPAPAKKTAAKRATPNRTATRKKATS